jgi:hypothetical protein
MSTDFVPGLDMGTGEIFWPREEILENHVTSRPLSDVS